LKSGCSPSSVHEIEAFKKAIQNVSEEVDSLKEIYQQQMAEVENEEAAGNQDCGIEEIDNFLRQLLFAFQLFQSLIFQT
jgi:hypothetical protein